MMTDYPGVVAEIEVLEYPESDKVIEYLETVSLQGRRSYTLDIPPGFLKKGTISSGADALLNFSEEWEEPVRDTLLLFTQTESGKRIIGLSCINWRAFSEEEAPPIPLGIGGGRVSKIVFHAASDPIKYGLFRGRYAFAGITETRVTIKAGVSNRKVSVLASVKEKVRLLMLTASVYNPALRYKFGPTGLLTDLDAPQTFMGPGQMAFLHENFNDIYYFNSIGVDVEIRVFIIWGI